MQFNTLTILDQAFTTLCSLAEETGVDAAALLQSLPPSGFLLRGSQVPVLSPRFRGSCSVLFYENLLPNGNSWPFIRFFTFKDGGIERRFNGLYWLKHQQHQSSAHPATRRVKPASCRLIDQQLMEAKKLRIFNDKTQEFDAAVPASPANPWLQQRLSGACTASLLNRIELRQHGQNRFLLPIQNNQVRIGYQQLQCTAAGHEKRFFTAYEGAMNGSYGRIMAVAGYEHLPCMLCEGLMTGLTLALVWPGRILLALTANNLPKLRQTLAEPVILAHDDDRWKPKIGNTGLQAALQAQRPGDCLVSPWFNANSLKNQPTDFNDLLRLEGMAQLVECLYAQLPEVWR